MSFSFVILTVSLIMTSVFVLKIVLLRGVVSLNSFPVVDWDSWPSPADRRTGLEDGTGLTEGF